MRGKITLLTLLLFPLFFLFACKKQSSNQGGKYQKQPTSMGGQITVAENRQPVMRDGIKTMACPGCQINYKKVDSMLQEVGLSYSTLVHTRKPEDMKRNIQKLKKLLQKQSVINDKELQVSYNLLLGGEYLRLSAISQQKNKEYLNQAIAYSKTALSIFKENSKYKADLIDGYSILISAYIAKKEYEKAISLLKYTIEEYQNIGAGPYQNWYTVNQIAILDNLSNTNKFKSGKDQEIVDYLKRIAGKYHNEVGIAAQIAVQRHYLKSGKQDKADALTESIKKRLVLLNDSAFKKEVWIPQKARLVRARIKKTRGQSIRDTVYYAIRPEMIDTASLSKMGKLNHYLIQVQLKEQYWPKFRKLTTHNIGNNLAVKYKDEIISPSYPIIQTTILRGYFSIGLFKNREKAKKTMQQILGK